MRTLDEINEKIRRGQAVVWTVEEVKALAPEWGVRKIAETVDVVCTGTFEPLESAGAVINLGHTDPPIKIRQCWFDGIPAYGGFGAVDLYLGVTAMADYASAELGDSEQRGHFAREERGGGHVIEDLINGKSVSLRALGQGTDCYPRTALETQITRDSINQFYLYSPRGLYQNFVVGVNGGERLLYTYLGPLQPRLGNAVYGNPGAISPLFNDPLLEVIGIGTRIFFGGGVGYVAWEGTQHFPLQKRLPNQTPIGPAATLALIGDAKQMQGYWVRGCYFKNYGASLMAGVAIPLPVLNEGVISHCAVRDEEIVAPVMDFSIPRRVRPTFGLVSYAQLKSGRMTIEGKTVRVAPLASMARSREAAQTLKQWIEAGDFLLTAPVAALPRERGFLPQDQLAK
ncbi:MAG: homocysteine biosynthesis protein [Cyanobacteriota bacterium]|nr:homocysteine biosynthesis protein [Cyanobacteriota bacterium]